MEANKQDAVHVEQARNFRCHYDSNPGQEEARGATEEAHKRASMAEATSRTTSEEAARLTALRAELEKARAHVAAKEEATSAREARCAAAESEATLRGEALQAAEQRVREREKEVAFLQKDLLAKVRRLAELEFGFIPAMMVVVVVGR